MDSSYKLYPEVICLVLLLEQQNHDKHVGGSNFQFFFFDFTVWK